LTWCNHSCTNLPFLFQQIPLTFPVNIFKDDSNIVHFSNPKVQANISANTFVVTGTSENKKMEELLPGILQHMGSLDGQNLKQMTERLQKMGAGKGIPGLDQLLQAAGGAAAAEDDDLPDLQEGTF
jgi:nascent polypeptide-associated complex subunit beta